MNRQRLLAMGFVLSVAAPLGAQTAGSIEIGGFGQFTRADTLWHVKDGAAAGGGRFGVFLSRLWELEADVSVARFANDAPRPVGNTSQQTFAGRLNFNIPIGIGHIILGAGAGGQRFEGTTDFSVSPDVGVRFMLGPIVALRFDGVMEWVENHAPENGSLNSQRSRNIELRGGLSFLTRTRPEPPPPPPAVVAQVRPEPQAVTTEPVPERREVAPPTPPRDNRDSIEAANRAREALTTAVLFEFDRSELNAAQTSLLDMKIPVMRANPNVRIRVIGNADERGSDEYNLALGMRRANAAKRYLTDHGIDESRIDITTYGEERPVCADHEETCWVQNRRDEFVIVAGGESLVAPR
jgi:peptidoglycan-associated lipoprotein